MKRDALLDYQQLCINLPELVHKGLDGTNSHRVALHAGRSRTESRRGAAGGAWP